MTTWGIGICLTPTQETSQCEPYCLPPVSGSAGTEGFARFPNLVACYCIPVSCTREYRAQGFYSSCTRGCFVLFAPRVVVFVQYSDANNDFDGSSYLVVPGGYIPFLAVRIRVSVVRRAMLRVEWVDYTVLRDRSYTLDGRSFCRGFPCKGSVAVRLLSRTYFYRVRTVCKAISLRRIREAMDDRNSLGGRNVVAE